MAADWTTTNRRILDALDIAAEYLALGVEVTGSSPSPTGWLECRVYGAADRNPSAGINIGTEHPQRGRYKEFTGEGHNLSLFTFAAMTGKFPDWKAARNHYAKISGVKLPRGTAPKDPAENLAFTDFNENLVRSWSQRKPPITIHSVRAAGGRLAGWPAKTKRYTVIALPIYGPHGVDDDPSGWVIYNQTGADLPLFQGNGTAPKPAKVLTTGGSKSGWLNRWGLGHLAGADVVWKTEGVSDMLALQSAIPPALIRSHIVLTNSGGTMEFPRPEIIAALAAKKVYVIHDADRPGQAGAGRWAAAIAQVAVECRNVVLPYEVAENHGKDIRDWLAEGHTYQDVLDLADAIQPLPTPATSSLSCPGPPPSPNGKPSDTANPLADPLADPIALDRHICSTIHLDVLGETPSGEILVFSTAHKKTVSIRDIARMKYANLLQIGGPDVKRYVHEATDGTEIAGTYHIDVVRKAMAVLGGQRRIQHDTTKGSGVWLGRNGDIVLVGAGLAAVWDGETLSGVEKPRAAGLILDISESTPWYDYSRLKTLLESSDRSWMVETVDEAITLFEKWYWKQEKNESGASGVSSTSPVIPSLVTGLLLATWIQSVWDWRPLVSITGESSSGKSTLFDMIGMIFGRLALQSSISTEAGLRQAIRNRSPLVLIDEFEHNKHRRQILELMRTSGKGARLLRGTMNQEGAEYGLKHIVWVAGIESGLERQPDRNRFIQLELAMPPLDRRGDIDLPNSSELEDLGQRLLAVAVYHARDAKALADRLKRHKFPDVHSRIVESFSTPSAILALVAGRGDEEGSRAILENILMGIDRDPGQGASDQEDLFHAILGSIVRVEKGEEAVAQLLARATTWEDGATSLQRSGITVGRKRSGPRGCDLGERREGDCLFICPHLVKRHLLKGTRWEEQAIDEILLRFEGAIRGARRLCGAVVRGVEIPMESLVRFFDEVEDCDANCQSSGNTQELGGF